MRDAIQRFRQQPDLIEKEKWLKPKGGEYEAGQAPYQQRVRCALAYIDQSHLVTNLGFYQAQSERELRKILGRADLNKHLDACWQVHQEILRVTEAKVIIALGRFTRQRLRRRFKASQLKQQGSGYARHYREWQCFWDRGTWMDRRIDIFSVPHFSYYNVANPAYGKVLLWLKNGIQAALNAHK